MEEHKMHPQIRHARFNLMVCGVTVLTTLAAFLLLLITKGPQKAQAAFAFTSFIGLTGFSSRFYNKKPGEIIVVMDERDIQIRDRSNMIAGRVVSMYWVLVCMGPWCWVALRSGLGAVDVPFVPVIWLPWVVISAWIVLEMTRSITILINYQRGEPTSNE